jgi:hypothetical protein
MIGTLTQWMIGWIVRRYDSPAEAIEAIAERVGVEIYLDREAAVAEAASEGECYTTRPAAISAAIDAGEARLVAESTGRYALEEGDEPILSLGDGEALLIDPPAIGTAEREVQLEYLADLANRLDLPPETWCVDPLKKIQRLNDDRETAYVWVLNSRSTGDDVNSLREALTSQYRDRHGRDPEALHMIVRDIDEIREIPSHVIEHTIKPWLRESDDESGKQGEVDRTGEVQ